MKSAATALSQDSILWLKDWIQEHTGIVFPEQKISLLQQRLDSLCIRLGYPSGQTVIDELKHRPSTGLIHQMIDIATTNHTHFFREIDAINYLIEEIIPAHNPTEQLRMWSAASSSGEELYTIALMLTQKYNTEMIKQRFSFLGTDVNPKVVDQAEKGIYTTHRLKEVPPDYLSKWFTPMGLDTWSVAEELKKLCLFRRLNLLSYPWPFSRLFHVVFLRNILYYFEPATQQTILNNIYEVTIPGGWLVTSVTESLASINVKWTRVKAGVYRKL